MRSLIILAVVAAAWILGGCAAVKSGGPSNAGTNTITVYSMEPVRGDDGDILQNADGSPVVRMTDPREVTERAFMAQLQGRTVEHCADIKRDEMSALKTAVEQADTATASEAWAETIRQRDLIAALKPDFDPTGCSTLIAAQGQYWATIREELQLMREQGIQQTKLLTTALKVAGFYLITDSIGDTLVGIAEGAGGINIGNRVAGDVKGAGGSGPGSAAATSSASGDTELGDDWIITTGKRSPVQMGDGQILSDEAGVNEGDGILGQLITRPANAQNLEGGDFDLDSGGAEGTLGVE